MKDFERKIVMAAVEDIRPMTRVLTPQQREAVLYGLGEQFPRADEIGGMTVEEYADQLTLEQSVELVYRLLGRMLEGVSSWRRMLRWAIKKVMGLLEGVL